MSVSVGEVATCNLCASETRSVLLVKNGHRIYRCPSCGLAFTHPQPQLPAEQYDASYFELYHKRREFRLRRACDRLSRIELITSPGRILDVGCSLGYFLEAASKRGWTPSGVEISPHAAQVAREHGLDVMTGTLEEAGYPESCFDCVTMWDVLEHVQDPTEHMLEVRRVLVPGGLVVIGTPNMNHVLFRIKRERWRHLKPTEHLYYFNPASIHALLRKTGFKPTRPPVLGGRSYRGSLGARLKCGVARLVQPNDVMTVYGVRT
jgi:SAM-dependent methyltransferase